MTNEILALAAAAAILTTAAAAEQFRLKYQTTVELLENGEVVGTKRVKGGTLIELVESPTSDAATSPAKAAKPDGSEHWAMVKVVPVRNPDDNSVLVIDYQPLTEGEVE